MNYKKFLIETNNSFDLVKEFVDWSMKGFTNDFVILDEKTMVIDTLYDIDGLKDEFNNLDVIIVDITNFEPESKKMSEAFFKLDILDDVNYFLDLINMKGGIDF